MGWDDNSLTTEYSQQKCRFKVWEMSSYPLPDWKSPSILKLYF